MCAQYPGLSRRSDHCTIWGRLPAHSWEKSSCIERKNLRKTATATISPNLIIDMMMLSIKLGSHAWFQIKIITVNSLYVVIIGLALFGFVLVHYLFCDVFYGMFTCLFCILFEFFYRSKLQKIRSIRIINNIIPNKKNHNRHGTCHRYYYCWEETIPTFTEPAMKNKWNNFFSESKGSKWSIS